MATELASRTSTTRTSETLVALILTLRDLDLPISAILAETDVVEKEGMGVYFFSIYGLITGLNSGCFVNPHANARGERRSRIIRGEAGCRP